jgi:hypothetical protein
MAMLPQLIRVEVVYEFSEYKALIQEFLPIALKSRGNINRNLPWNRPWVEKMTLATVLPLIFWIKKFRVGKCIFEFTPQGLSRTSKGHTASRSWKDITMVHRLSAAYLIELRGGGAMPVPYRVLSSAERTAFEALIQTLALNSA